MVLSALGEKALSGNKHNFTALKWGHHKVVPYVCVVYQCVLFQAVLVFPVVFARVVGIHLVPCLEHLGY